MFGVPFTLVSVYSIVRLFVIPGGLGKGVRVTVLEFCYKALDGRRTALSISFFPSPIPRRGREEGEVLRYNRNSGWRRATGNGQGF